MARLQTVLDSINASLGNAFPTLICRTGHKYLGEKVIAPRVVWVPGKDRYGAATDGRHTRPRSVRTRSAEVFAHCFHDSFGDCEELVNALIYAVHANITGSYTVDDGDWAEPEWLEHGYLCVLRFLIDIPVTAPVPVTVTVPIVSDNTNTVQGDGFLDVGESS